MMKQSIKQQIYNGLGGIAIGLMVSQVSHAIAIYDASATASIDLIGAEALFVEGEVAVLFEDAATAGSGFATFGGSPDAFPAPLPMTVVSSASGTAGGPTAGSASSSRVTDGLLAVENTTASTASFDVVFDIFYLLSASVDDAGLEAANSGFFIGLDVYMNGIDGVWDVFTLFETDEFLDTLAGGPTLSSSYSDSYIDSFVLAPGEFLEFEVIVAAGGEAMGGASTPIPEPSTLILLGLALTFMRFLNASSLRSIFAKRFSKT